MESSVSVISSAGGSTNDPTSSSPSAAAHTPTFFVDPAYYADSDPDANMMTTTTPFNVNNNNHHHGMKEVPNPHCHDDWQLTWPIWHMLPRAEQKALAVQHGYKTIGDFEEYMTLQTAVGESYRAVLRVPASVRVSSAITANKNDNGIIRRRSSSSTSSYASLQQSIKTPSSNSTLFDSRSRRRIIEREAESKSYAFEPDTEEDDEDRHDSARRLEDNVKSISESDDYSSNNNHHHNDDDDDDDNNKHNTLPKEDLVRLGGLMLLLPEEIIHRVIMGYCSIDTYATCARVSPHWKFFTRTEPVYQRVCERLYLNQCKRQTLRVSRFGGRYHQMLCQRPHVRVGGGAYVLKYKRIHPIQRDMWTEIPKGAVLEHVYYRYLYFQEDGRVLYALTTAPPTDVFHRFVRMMLLCPHHNRNDNGSSTSRGLETQQLSQQQQQQQIRVENSCAWGTYQVRRHEVVVMVQQPWQFVRFQLTIQSSTLHGKHGMLSLDTHISNTSPQFSASAASLSSSSNCVNQVHYKVPEEPFRFVHDNLL